MYDLAILRLLTTVRPSEIQEEWDKQTVVTPRTSARIFLTMRDLVYLQPEKWLNDSVVNFLSLWVHNFRFAHANSSSSNQVRL